MVLIGDVNAFSWSMKGANGTSTFQNGVAQATGTKLTFEDDILSGGESEDLLVGDVNSFTWELKGGVGGRYQAFSKTLNTNIKFGHDELDGGAGNDCEYTQPIVTFPPKVVRWCSKKLVSNLNKKF